MPAALPVSPPAAGKAVRHFIRYEVQFFSDTVSALDWLLSYQNPAAQANLEQEWGRHPINLSNLED